MSDEESEIFQLVADVALGRYDAVGAASFIAEKIQSNLESTLPSLWIDIIDLARGSREGQGMLVDLSVALSQLPDITDERGPVKLYGGVVWRDLPMLGWEVNSIWNNRSSNDQLFVNGAHFIAMLINTDKPVFRPYRLQILWSFRSLEEKQDSDIPTIAAIVSVLGTKIATWDDEYESGPTLGAPGRGGVLWNGKHGFSSERYALWKKCLVDVSEQSTDDRIRTLAAETVVKM